VRIADTKKKEILLLAQDGEYLVFGVHTGAAVLRLRPPLFALRNAFPTRVSNAQLPDDTARVSGRYVARDVTMTAQSGLIRLDRRVPLTASLGWTFWLPFQWFIEGTHTEFAVSCTWFACLMIPLGYWSLRINHLSPSQGILGQWFPVFLAGVALLCGGLVIVPLGFGLPAAPIGEWLATLTGALVGSGLGALVTKLVGKRALSEASPGG
jgi:hypothetical protein